MTMSKQLGSRLRSVAAIMLVSYGIVLLAAALLEVRDQAGIPTAQSWSVLHIVIVLALAIGLVRGKQWALWGAVLLTVAALIMLPPIVFAVLGGPPRDALVPRIDLILLIAEVVILVAVGALLFSLQRATRRPAGGVP
jgi:hypothetical protein